MNAPPAMPVLFACSISSGSTKDYLNNPLLFSLVDNLCLYITQNPLFHCSVRSVDSLYYDRAGFELHVKQMTQMYSPECSTILQSNRPLKQREVIGLVLQFYCLRLTHTYLNQSSISDTQINTLRSYIVTMLKGSDSYELYQSLVDKYIRQGNLVRGISLNGDFGKEYRRNFPRKPKHTGQYSFTNHPVRYLNETLVSGFEQYFRAHDHTEAVQHLPMAQQLRRVNPINRVCVGLFVLLYQHTAYLDKTLAQGPLKFHSFWSVMNAKRNTVQKLAVWGEIIIRPVPTRKRTWLSTSPIAPVDSKRFKPSTDMEHQSTPPPPSSVEWREPSDIASVIPSTDASPSNEEEWFDLLSLDPIQMDMTSLFDEIPACPTETDWTALLHDAPLTDNTSNEAAALREMKHCQSPAEAMQLFVSKMKELVPDTTQHSFIEQCADIVMQSVTKHQTTIDQ